MAKKIHETTCFEYGERRMKVTLIEVSGHPKPWRVRCEVSEGRRLVEAGYIACDSVEKNAREMFGWSNEQAVSKGWAPTTTRGSRMKILSAIPSPMRKGDRAEAVAVATKARARA